MTLRKVIRPRADLDIEEQFKYLSRQSRETAVRFLRAVYATIDDLTAAPQLGGIWQSPEPRLAGVRVWQVRGFRNHLIFYRPTNELVEFLRVLHGARDLRNALRRG